MVDFSSADADIGGDWDRSDVAKMGDAVELAPCGESGGGDRPCGCVGCGWGGKELWRISRGLVEAAGRLRSSGCSIIYLDGSYVTRKPRPRDFDACWDPIGVDPRKLDPIFLDFNNTRAAQKAAFKGEFFPSSTMCANVSQTFVEFLQLDRFTGKTKGFVSVSLLADRRWILHGPCTVRTGWN